MINVQISFNKIWILYFLKQFVMKKALMKMPIQDRYAYIRDVYRKLNENFPLTVEILEISRNTWVNALSIMNPTPKVYDKKLTEEHMVYIHSKTITQRFRVNL